MRGFDWGKMVGWGGVYRGFWMQIFWQHPNSMGSAPNDGVGRSGGGEDGA